MGTNYKPGNLSYAGGLIPFGQGKPTLCVNDQMGYYIEEDKVLSELKEGKLDFILEQAEKSIKLGFNVINVQLMRHGINEAKLVPQVVEKLVKKGSCCVAIDSRNPKIVDEALSLYPYKAMCNVVNGEQDNLKAMLPVIAKHGAAIGTALVDEKGIPQTVQERLAVGKKIVDAALAYGIPREDIMLDAICFPAGVVENSMRTAQETIKAFHEELGVATLLGISNAGYMMPKPRLIDLTYFIACVSWGLDVAMIDPFTPNLAWFTKAIDFLMGFDPYAVEYLKFYRAEENSKNSADQTVC
ncbi:MAG: dihydropteroate synthase [Zhaonellaceae bacterium]